jgi:hypothetical protein
MRKAATASKVQPTNIPWQQIPHQTMQDAGRIASLSPASLYRYAAEGRLKLRRLAGRTLVDTQSLIALIESAEEWTPSDRAEKARITRVERARAAWQD